LPPPPQAKPPSASSGHPASNSHTHPPVAPGQTARPVLPQAVWQAGRADSQQPSKHPSGPPPSAASANVPSTPAASPFPAASGRVSVDAPGPPHAAARSRARVALCFPVGTLLDRSTAHEGHFALVPSSTRSTDRVRSPPPARARTSIRPRPDVDPTCCGTLDGLSASAVHASLPFPCRSRRCGPRRGGLGVPPGSPIELLPRCRPPCAPLSGGGRVRWRKGSPAYRRARGRSVDRGDRSRRVHRSGRRFPRRGTRAIGLRATAPAARGAAVAPRVITLCASRERPCTPRHRASFVCDPACAARGCHIVLRDRVCVACTHRGENQHENRGRCTRRRTRRRPAKLTAVSPVAPAPTSTTASVPPHRERHRQVASTGFCSYMASSFSTLLPAHSQTLRKSRSATISPWTLRRPLVRSQGPPPTPLSPAVAREGLNASRLVSGEFRATLLCDDR